MILGPGTRRVVELVCLRLEPRELYSLALRTNASVCSEAPAYRARWRARGPGRRTDVALARALLLDSRGHIVEGGAITREETKYRAMKPVLRPKLPSARAILPYLERVDAARIYSNFGPLVCELQSRLQDLLLAGEGQVICTSSGTSALSAAILASAGRAGDKRIAIVPDLTFAATAAAVERCGYDLHLTEVDRDNWQLDPDVIRRHPRLAEVGVVVPVAAYGQPVAQACWVRFMQDTGIPVVIDAAAAFASLLRAPGRYVGAVPAAISFHATKSFGVGEGGCIAWSAPRAEQRLSEAINFGFFEDRRSIAPSLNGKMSEYHAAVGLAELDSWNDKTAAFERVVASYRRYASALGLEGRMILFPESDYIYPMFNCADDEESRLLQDRLSQRGYGSRMWYRLGLHSHPEFARCTTDDLAASEWLASRLLGLPMAVDLDDRDVSEVLDVISGTLHKPARSSASSARVGGLRSESSVD